MNAQLERLAKKHFEARMSVVNELFTHNDEALDTNSVQKEAAVYAKCMAIREFSKLHGLSEEEVDTLQDEFSFSVKCRNLFSFVK